MSNDRDEWLANLKVGDRVAIQHNPGGDYSIAKISKLTRANVETNDGREFRRKTGSSLRGGYSYHTLTPITDDVKNQIQWRKLEYTLELLHKGFPGDRYRGQDLDLVSNLLIQLHAAITPKPE